MRIDRRFFRWGVFFILVGAVPLALRAGYLTTAQMDDLWRFWPVVVIAAGIGILLQRTPLEWIGGLLSSVLFGVFVGAMLAGGFGGVASVPGAFCGSGDADPAFATRDGEFATTSGTVNIESPCGDLTIRTGPGSRWTVDGSDADGVGPNVESDRDRLNVDAGEGNGGPFGWARRGGTWLVTIPTEPTLDVDVEVDAGSALIDLDQARLGSLEVQVNAGRMTLDLGSVATIAALDVQGNAGSIAITLPAATFQGTIQANAASVSLCLPAGIGLRIETGRDALASYDFAARGLIKDGSVWSTPGFDSATSRIELEVQANAGSIRLDAQEACGG